MLLDWFTVCAQIINLFLLIFLLKHFLYRPILEAIRERESRLSKIQDDAVALKNEAIKEKEEYVTKNKIFEDMKNKTWEELQESFSQEKIRFLRKLEEEQNKEKEFFKVKLHKEKNILIKEVLKKVGKEVFSISEKILKEFSTQKLQKEIFKVLINKLEVFVLEESQKEAFSENGVFFSAFTLEENEQNQIKELLARKWGKDLFLSFDVDTSLVGGFELRSPSYKLSWTYSETLIQLERKLNELIL